MDNRLQENLQNRQHNYIAPFLWLHGEDDNLIIDAIHKIYDSGIRSVCLESRTHEDFCRQGWWEDLDIIFAECKRLEMNVWILDDKHFPSGYANGIFEDKYKELRPFGITEYHVDVSGPCNNSCVMADCWKCEPEDEILSVVACRHIPGSDSYTEIIDISEGLSDGFVYFTLPEGLWRIVFLIKTRSGIHKSLLNFCDNLNPYTIDFYINEVYKPHYDHFGKYFGNTFLGFFSDEPGFRNNTKTIGTTPIGTVGAHYPYHKNIINALSSKYGKKTIPTLAGLWFDINGISSNIRLDYMNAITDAYRDNFCNKIAAWCHEHGIMYIGHIIEDNNAHYKTGNTAGHYFKALDGQDMSGIDVVLQQIVPGLTECSNSGYVSYKHMNNKFFHYYLAKLASSFAHIDSKKQGRAMCEIFGAYGWAEGTKTMKYLADHMLVRGINYFVPHAFSPKPNDTDCPPNFYDSGKNPQYKYFKLLMDYMNRMCHLFSGGKHIPTCAILYDAEAHWSSTDCLPLEDIAKVLYDNLLDYDIIPISYLDKIDEDGYLNGEKIPVLLVPYAENLPDYAVNKLKSLNIPVISVDKNKESTLFKNATLSNLIDFMSPYRDVTAEYDGKFLRYYHYRRNNSHFYMFSNEDINNTVTAEIQLSSFDGGSYVIYDAMENKAYTRKAKSKTVKITVHPYNAVVVMFGDLSVQPDFDKEIIITESKPVAPVFDISIRKEQDNEYLHYTQTDKLFNITGAGKLADFSGNIKYQGILNIQSPCNLILDLGQVGETAELYINNHKVGSRIIPPYTFDISDFVKTGENEITVITANTNVFQYRDDFSKYLLIEASGVLGPITLKKYKKRDF